MATPMEFNIPVLPASEALLAFSKQAKIEVLFSFNDLRRVRSTAVVGQYEPADAIARMLSGTGCVVQRKGNGVAKFVVTPASPPTGSISGRLLAPDGTPAPGLRVVLRGAPQAAATDSKGNFYFESVPPGSYGLVIDAPGYQPLQMTGVQVEADRLLVLVPQALRLADDPTQLEPYIVQAKAERRQPFDRSRTPLLLPEAIGNLDLPRTENDPLPYTIYDRDQITRSGVVDLNEFLRRSINADVDHIKSAPLHQHSH